MCYCCLVQVVDARPAGRWRGEAPEPRPGLPSGHIPGSLNVPFAEVLEGGRYGGAVKEKREDSTASVSGCCLGPGKGQALPTCLVS